MKMRLTTSLLLLSVSMGGTLFAKQVDQATAKKVAENFIAGKLEGSKALNVRLTDKIAVNADDLAGQNAYYVFDVNGQGFVVVAADDIAQPVLAYSVNKPFGNHAGLSPQTAYWMDIYQRQMEFLIKNNVEATEEIEQQWTRLIGKGAGNTAMRPTAVVEPMLTTTWNQGTNYNLYTPGTGNGKTPVGCVATAMAQIMKYWNYPVSGTGSYSYNSQSYGNLSADFAATTYNWSMMPDAVSASSLTSSKEAVSELGYHCAIAVRMSFSPSGSGSQVLAWGPNSRSAENAFKNHFGYKSTIEGLQRSSFSEANWIARLKTELDASRPILYAGFGNSGGHAFVFDGYDENNMFHINWGWGGMSDGYFTVNNLNPSALGIGGGGGGFNYDQQVLVNIEPDGPSATLLPLKLGVGNEVSISSPEIQYGTGFSVDAVVENICELDYKGGFLRAEVFTADSTYVTFFNRLSNQDVLVAATKDVTFTTNGLNALEAGDYFIKIGYVGIENDWHMLEDHNGFTNHVDFKVVGSGTPNSITELDLAQTVSVYPNPANSRVQVNLGAMTAVRNISLFNVQGQMVHQVADVKGSVAELPVSQLSEGVYYIRVSGKDGIITKKIVVKH
jgi:hypothetical protein